MMGIAAPGTKFAGASALLRELAGLTLAPKTVERHAEALGREIADDECGVIESETCDAPSRATAPTTSGNIAPAKMPESHK